MTMVAKMVRSEESFEQVRMQAQVRRAARLWCSGLTIIEISEKMGVNKGVVHRWRADRPEWAEVVQRYGDRIDDQLDLQLRKLAKRQVSHQSRLVHHADKTLERAIDAEALLPEEAVALEAIVQKSTVDVLDRLVPKREAAPAVQVNVQQGQQVQTVGSIWELDSVLGLTEQ